MWDYNGDGVVDSYDDEEYWDDVYFEEHRDDYSPYIFSSGSSFCSYSKGATQKTTYKKNNSSDKGVSPAFGILYLTLAICLIVPGIACLMVFPPLGVLLLWPMYKLMGGRMTLF